MRLSTLLARNLAWYWRTNLAVVCGVATAVAVLGGALVVGESVRGSLRDLVLARLGGVDYVVSRPGFFREALAESVPGAAPAIVLEALVSHEPSGRRASRVPVYGIDSRFREAPAPEGRDVLATPALADELGLRSGDTVLLRVEKPSDIPLESLHGRKDDVGRTLRLRFAGTAPREFSIQPRQGPVRAVFVPLARLQRDLGRAAQANTLLVSGGEPRPRYTLEDFGVRLRVLEKQQMLSVETDSALLGEELAGRVLEVARALNRRAAPVLTYLVNTIRVGDREIPYSLVSGIEGTPAGVTLNAWAARELGATPGDRLTMEYYVWQDEGRLGTATAQFDVAAIVPVTDQRDLAPEYPGITESESLHDWDPPFPLDLRRIRPGDEQYWKQYRTTPKAFLPLARAQELWGTRYGKLTSIRVEGTDAGPFRSRLLASLDPARMGVSVFAAKAEGLAASRGATDFGEYFLYFSFFLMASALLLAGLFFRLGVEQRMREIGVLRALGFGMPRIRALFLAEGAVLASAGALAGVAGAVAYGALILLGLRTWWIGAVGTRMLALHASGMVLAAGAAAGIAAGLLTLAWTLRGLQAATPRALIATAPRRAGRRARRGALVLILAGALLLAAALPGWLNQTASFFGAGTLLLAGLITLQWLWLSRPPSAGIDGIARLGFRSASHRPGRSVLCIALIASAAFLIVAVEAFRRDTAEPEPDFPLMAESVLPLLPENFPRMQGVRLVPFRLRPGDDASCLNLYRPRNPRILAVPPGFTRRGGEWQALDAQPEGGAVPAVADATSLAYALHLKIGDELAAAGHRFRIAGALRDSLFQSEILIAERHFVRLFPDEPGYRFFLIETAPERAGEVAGALERELSDYGLDVLPTAERLAAYHRVENTYLSTFQALGGLGLVLGTIGLAAVLLRNLLERRKELALLRAVGYRRVHLAGMALAENGLLLAAGLATGTACALVAIAPALLARGGRLPALSILLLLAAVLAAGLAASLAATRAALRSPLLPALRSE